MKQFDITSGYTPGIIGRVAELHAAYYAREWNFGHFFEVKVASELAGFINSYDSNKDRIWSLLINGTIEGSITIDSSGEGPGLAHLRWFIVSDKARGTGGGGRLMKLAVDFCRQLPVRKVYLWTFRGLEAAKHLYLRSGFKPVEEHDGEQWGTTVTEQRYELVL